MKLRTSVLLCCLLHSIHAACVFNQSAGISPQPGSCAGPENRAVSRLSNVKDNNRGCAANQVSFFIDEDPNKPQCGECFPGTSGHDPFATSLTCAINEYCTDNGTCATVLDHPLYKADCPYDTGSYGVSNWCGPGLRCYQHVCKVCMDGECMTCLIQLTAAPGMIDSSDGKICVGELWTYSRWIAMQNDPGDVFLLLIFLMLLLFVIYLAYRLYKTKFGKKKPVLAPARQSSEFNSHRMSTISGL